MRSSICIALMSAGCEIDLNERFVLPDESAVNNDGWKARSSNLSKYRNNFNAPLIRRTGVRGK